MVWQSVRFGLLAGVVAAVAGVSARADDCAAPAPSMQTVKVQEWVPEKYQCTRTVYRTECKQETYTAYKCECVPETRTRTCTVYKQVAEARTETRNVCVCVPTVEERTVMTTHVTCKPETHMVRKCVDKGHWECREVPCKPRLWDRFKHLCKRHDDCCEESCCPPPTKTVRVWVPCPTYVEVPVTCYKRVCESRPVTCKVTVYKTVMKQETCQVTSWKCVPEQKTETYQVMVTRQVPYQATRTVAVCVPHQETFTATRMVCRTVEKQVPAASCCETSCCKPQCHRSSGLHLRHHDCCD